MTIWTWISSTTMGYPLLGPLTNATADSDEVMSIVHSSAMEYLINLAQKAETPHTAHKRLGASLGNPAGADKVLASACLDPVGIAVGASIANS